MIGIDVSSHQGNINWEKVMAPNSYKGSPIDFAIIRAFIGTNVKYDNVQLDKMFEKNFQKMLEAADKANRTPGVKRPGEFKYGFYIIPYAMSVERAIDEAHWVLDYLDRKKLFPSDIDMGIWYDAEGEGAAGFSNLGSLGRVEIGLICDRFCDLVSARGYKSGIYCNSNWLKNKIDKEVTSKWPLWLANYGSDKKDPNPPAVKHVDARELHQYSRKGKVSGITNDCDMNICYSNL